MEFRFTEEQEMIRETAASFLAENCQSAQVRAAMASEAGYDDAFWEKICNEMGWPALLVPEFNGGLGLGFVEMVATLEQTGRFLLCSPFFASACLSVLALRLLGSDQQQTDWLPRLAAGETASLAVDAMMDRNKADATVRVETTISGLVLNGHCRYVPNGHSVDTLMAIAADSEESLRLCIVSAKAEGIRRQRLPTMDQTRPLAEVHFEAVAVESETMVSLSALERLLDLASVAMAAEQLGCAQQALDISVDYTRERVQFGRSIASYQAIKHKAADMMLKVEAARSAVYYAACVADEALNGGVLAASLAEAASVAKSYCNDAAFFCAGSGLQLHGGVGFTEEYDIQLYFKRARSCAHFLGTAEWHRERIAALLLDAEEVA